MSTSSKQMQTAKKGSIKKIYSPVFLDQVISNGEAVEQCRFTLYTTNQGFSNSLIFFCDREGIHFDEMSIDLKNIKRNFQESLRKTATFFNKFYKCKCVSDFQDYFFYERDKAHYN